MNSRAKKLLRLAAALVTITCIYAFAPWQYLLLKIMPAADSVEEEVNSALNEGFVGIVVYIDQAGKTPKAYAAGLSNRTDSVSMTPETLTKIASISKLYIAAAVTKLIGEGELNEDDKLSSLLPELAKDVENANEITLRMLVQHRSGIPNFTDDAEWKWPEPPQSLDEYYALSVNRGADFEPNASYAYSNTNYLFLGAIMDRVLGYSHHQYIQEQILNPLNLKNTYFLMDDAGWDNVSEGYFLGWKPSVKGQNFISPGGSMVSTAREVAIFQRALVEGDFFSEEEQKIYESLYPYDHTGLLPGYQSIARYHPDIDTVIVQLMNASGGNQWLMGEAVYDRITRLISQGTK